MGYLNDDFQGHETKWMMRWVLYRILVNQNVHIEELGNQVDHVGGRYVQSRTEYRATLNRPNGYKYTSSPTWCSQSQDTTLNGGRLSKLFGDDDGEKSIDVKTVILLRSNVHEYGWRNKDDKAQLNQGKYDMM